MKADLATNDIIRITVVSRLSDLLFDELHKIKLDSAPPSARRIHLTVLENAAAQRDIFSDINRVAEAPPDRQLSKSPSKSRYQCYHFGMAQLLVRDLEEEVVQALRQRAAEEGTSVEEAHRRLLRSFLLHKKPSKTFKEALLEMPDDGDDSIFQRVERKPRKIVL